MPPPPPRDSWNNGYEGSRCPKKRKASPAFFALTLMVFCQPGTGGLWKLPGTRASVELSSIPFGTLIKGLIPGFGAGVTPAENVPIGHTLSFHT